MWVKRQCDLKVCVRDIKVCVRGSSFDQTFYIQNSALCDRHSCGSFDQFQLQSNVILVNVGTQDEEAKVP